MISKKKTLMLALATACAAPAFAADGPSYSLSGFGTLGLSKQNSHTADFVRPLQPEESSFGLDSNLGVQLNAEFNPTFSATVQMLARRSTRDDFKVKPELAFVKAKLAPNLSVRVGRVALPAYLISDSRHIGYANIAIRPQAEVYGQVPLTSLDGIDLTASTDVGAWTLTGNIGYGGIESEYSESIKIKGEKMFVANVTAETGPFTFRLAHVKTDLTVKGSATGDGLLAALRATGFGALAGQLEAKKKASDFTGLGMTMDYKNVLVQAEITRRTSDSYVPDLTGKYVTLGYRMGDIVPYVSYGTVRQDSPRTDNTVPRVGPLLPLAMGVNQLLEGEAQDGSAIGVRWNFAKSASLKVQADWVKPKHGDGYLVATPAYKGERVRAVAAAVDFVF